MTQRSLSFVCTPFSAIALTPTTILLQNQPTAQYAVTGIVCLLTGTVLLAITFVPKVTTYILCAPSCECPWSCIYTLQSLQKISPWFQNTCICMNYHLLFWTLPINDGCIIQVLTNFVCTIQTLIQMYSLYKDPSGGVNLDFSNITTNLSQKHPRGSDVVMKVKCMNVYRTTLHSSSFSNALCSDNACRTGTKVTAYIHPVGNASRTSRCCLVKSSTLVGPCSYILVYHSGHATFSCCCVYTCSCTLFFLS